MTKREEILQVLSSVTDPWMNTDYVSARMAKISDDAQAVTIQLGYPAKTVKKDIELKLQDAFQKAGIQGRTKNYCPCGSTHFESAA